MRTIEGIGQPEGLFEFHIEIDRIEGDEGEAVYVAGIAREDGSRVEAIASLDCGFAATEPNNLIYENWKLRFLANVLIDIAATESGVPRGEGVYEVLVARSGETDGLFVRQKQAH